MRPNKRLQSSKPRSTYWSACSSHPRKKTNQPQSPRPISGPGWPSCAHINYLSISIRSLTTSLKGAGYCSLGSLARNAIFSDILESLCWPLEAGLDKSGLQSKRTANHHLQIVPWLNRALAGSVGAGMIWRKILMFS